MTTAGAGGPSFTILAACKLKCSAGAVIDAIVAEKPTARKRTDVSRQSESWRRSVLVVGMRCALIKDAPQEKRSASITAIAAYRDSEPVRLISATTVDGWR